MPSHPLVEIQTKGQDIVARFACRALDWETSRVVGDELAGLVRWPGRHNLRLDLGSVQFLTAVGLGMLVATQKELRARGGRLVLSNVGLLAHEVFRAARLDRLLDIRRGSDNRLPVVDGDAGVQPSLSRPSCWT
jgi:anti-anti-sigma factor